MVFTARSVIRVRDGIVALSSFCCPERQGEEPHFRRWFEESGFAVCEVPRVTPFEGEEMRYSKADGSRLWAGHGPRTGQKSHRQLTDLWGIEVVPLRLVDPRFYHLDTCFCPLSNGEVMYDPAAFDATLKRHSNAVRSGEADLRFRVGCAAVCMQCSQHWQDNSP